MTLRVLVVGAGAIGGCFVGRLLELVPMSPGDAWASRSRAGWAMPTASAPHNDDHRVGPQCLVDQK